MGVGVRVLAVHRAKDTAGVNCRRVQRVQCTVLYCPAPHCGGALPSGKCIQHGGFALLLCREVASGPVLLHALAPLLHALAVGG